VIFILRVVRERFHFTVKPLKTSIFRSHSFYVFGGDSLNFSDRGRLSPPFGDHRLEHIRRSFVVRSVWGWLLERSCNINMDDFFLLLNRQLDRIFIKNTDKELPVQVLLMSVR